MSSWADELTKQGQPWEVFTALRYDPILRTSEDKLQSRPDGSKSLFYLSEYHRQRLVRAAEHFAWRECVNEPTLSNDVAWEACLSKAVAAYQEANVGQDVTANTPLKIRVAIINPKIIEMCREAAREPANSSGEKMNDYMGTLQRSSQALETGLVITVIPVPAQPLEQLFPLTLDASTEEREALSHQFSIVVDIRPTKASPFTYVKTYPRIVYDAATARMKITLASKAANNDTKAQAPAAHEETDVAPVKYRMNEVVLYNDAGNITEGSFTNIFFRREGRWVTPPVGPDHGGLPGVGRRWALERGLCVEQIVPRDDVNLNEEVWLSNGVRGFMPGTIVSID